MDACYWQLSYNSVWVHKQIWISEDIGEDYGLSRAWQWRASYEGGYFAGSVAAREVYTCILCKWRKVIPTQAGLIKVCESVRLIKDCVYTPYLNRPVDCRAVQWSEVDLCKGRHYYQTCAIYSLSKFMQVNYFHIKHFLHFAQNF